MASDGFSTGMVVDARFPLGSTGEYQCVWCRDWCLYQLCRVLDKRLTAGVRSGISLELTSSLYSGDMPPSMGGTSNTSQVVRHWMMCGLMRPFDM